MQTDPSALPLSRDALIAAITSFLSHRSAETLDRVRLSLQQEIDHAGPGAFAGLNERFANAGAAWSYYPHDPLARRIHHALAETLLPAESTLTGYEWIASLVGDPLVIVANHLSYADANLLEILLTRGGGAAVAERLTVMAGPKVYSSRTRRFSSLCFATIKTPQNTGRSSEDAVMNPRQVAAAARHVIDLAHRRLRLGDALLVFPEGTRSRTSDMQPLLGGVTRYLDFPGSWIVPVGIVGTEAMFPVGDDRLHSVPIVARIGQPLRSEALCEQTAGNRRLMMEIIGLAIAQLIPPAYRGAYADEVPGLDSARQLIAGHPSST